jgi:hypothetical protein
MMNHFSRIFIIPSFIILFFFLQTGCAKMTLSKPTPTIVPSPTIRPPKPTRTPTTTPTQTALPSATPTISSTPTLPPPLDDFSQARLYSSGPKPGWDFSFTLILAEEIKGNYNALIGDPPKPFTCRPLIEYAHPDRLYCSGRIPAAEKQVDYQIIEKESGQIVFKGNLFVPVP